MEDVVEINTFHKNVQNTTELEKEFDKFRSVYDIYFPTHYPAWTAVGTTALLMEEAPVEMRVMAVIGSGKKPKVIRFPPPKGK